MHDLEKYQASQDHCSLNQAAIFSLTAGLLNLISNETMAIQKSDY